MITLTEFSIPNGSVTEVYTVERDCDGIFIRNVMDSDQGGPCDTIYLDPRAARPIALALLRSEEPPIYVTGQNVLVFPGVRT
jgi:hypothetical protein